MAESEVIETPASEGFTPLPTGGWTLPASLSKFIGSRYRPPTHSGDVAPS
jgi:hypothetical protein